MSEEPERQHEESVLQGQLSELGQREGIRRSDFAEFLQTKTPDLWKFWCVSEAWDEGAIRNHVRSELLKLKAAIPHDESAEEKRLRPDNVVYFNEVFDAVFNLASNAKCDLLGKRLTEARAPDAQGRRYKRIILAQLERLILATGYEPVSKLPTSEEVAEPVTVLPSPCEDQPDVLSVEPVEVQHKISGETDDPSPVSTKNGVVISKPLLAGATAVLVVVLGIAVYLIVNSGDSGARDPQAGGPTTPSANEGQPLIFDDLGGGSPIIQVYPGASGVPGDKVANGTFNSGDRVTALCKTRGRSVSSAPQLGEQPRTSEIWFRIIGIPGMRQYATAVYVKDPDALLGKLHDC
ncbi:hypothetical protein [Amycolatopsis sp. NPDC059657]|uniref:hypothetical protein n=1 Tax=Amycolatopsis sp. NPDC059657 TaxID=3346899 RepID=UPI00367234AD